MDNLLIGKSRKEASRMFFETLVLSSSTNHIIIETISSLSLASYLTTNDVPRFLKQETTFM